MGCLLRKSDPLGTGIALMVNHVRPNESSMASQVGENRKAPSGRTWRVDDDPFGYRPYTALFGWLKVAPRPSIYLDLKSLWPAICLLSLSLVCFSVWHLVHRPAEAAQPFVFVEVRAIDPQGRPVTGAAVHFNHTQMGLTDAFGEWRRLLRLTTGQRVDLTIVKNTPTQTLQGSKTLKVPDKAPDRGDIEMRTALRLNLQK